MQDSDSQLIAEAIQGSQKAYAVLEGRYKTAIFHIVLKIVRDKETAHDLVQETFMKAFAALASYRSEYRFSTWLYKIAANSSIDFLRKKRIKALSLDKEIDTGDGKVEIEIPEYTYPLERAYVRNSSDLLDMKRLILCRINIGKLSFIAIRKINQTRK